MFQFEYKTIVLNSKDMDDTNEHLTDKLNKYGKNGWELVSFVTQPSLGSSKYNLVGITQKNILIFKRQLVDNI